MSKRKSWFWIVGGVLLIAGLLVGGLSVFGLLPWQSGKVSGNLYQDPQGRFTMTVGSTWEQVQNEERYARPQIPLAQADELVAQVNTFHGPGLDDIVLGKGKAYATIENLRILPPWGGLRGTPSDITHFLQMFLDGGRFGDNQILKPETIAAMQKMQLSTDGSPLGFGLSWRIGKDDFGTFYYHDGGAPGTEDKMRYYPDLDLGVVVMANVEGYQSVNIADGLVSAWMAEK